MWQNWQFYVNSILLGIGLAMDACAVSMANGMNEPKMKVGKITLIALTFGFFQALMPEIGWVCVRLVAQEFQAFTKAIPYIALILLGFIGGKMIYEGTNIKDEQPDQSQKLTIWLLLTQAFATSIDALSVGFTIADYKPAEALVCVAIIAVVTFAISFGGVVLGKKFGTKLGRKAEILGGVILVAIGVEIFVSSFF